MMIFYFLAALLITATIILLITGLKGSSASHKSLMIFFSLAFCLLGGFIWLFSGMATRYTFPYQSAATAKVRVSEERKDLRFFPPIKDGRLKEEKTSTAPQKTNADSHDGNNAEMIAMAQNLENKLRTGEAPPESWSMLYRTYVFLGQNDKAAEALLEGIKAFDEGSEMHDKFKQDIQSFVEGGYEGSYISQLKALLP